MESNINGGEDTQPKDCSPQITDSIIEQRSNEDTGNCDHFSIRAYVAEIRKRDWKICWPFCSSVECKEPNNCQEFRCWYCQNCLGSSDSSHDAADTCVVPTIYDDKDCEGNVDITSYEYLPLINVVSKEKISSAMSNTKIRHNVFTNGKKESNVAKTVHEGISEPDCRRRKDIQFLNEENVTIDAETKNLDVGGDPNIGILDIEFGERKLKCKITRSNETCFKGDPVLRVPEIAKTCEKGMESITYLQLPETGSMESGSLDSQASCYRNLCSLKSNRTDQKKEAESVHGEQQSDLTKILKCKRPQKIRLLSDILGREISGGSCDFSSSNGAVNSDNMDTRVTDTESEDDSDDLTLDTLFRTQKIVQLNTGKINGCRNKRKRLQVEDLRPGQSRWSNSESEVWSCRNTNKENNSAQSVIGSSESVKTALSRDDCLVSRVDKKQRKSSFEDRRPSSKMSQKNLSQESLLVSKDADSESKETQNVTGNHLFHLPKDARTGFNLLKPNAGESQDCDRKSVSCVKEGHDKGSLMLPHEFVPMKEQVGGKDVNVGPYFPASNRGSDSPRHLKNKHGTFKRKKGSSFPCNYENNIVAQANSEAKEISSSELDALGDIPMEIVKLLAENRRERRLLEAETADRETVGLLRTVNGVENPRKVHPTRAYDDISPRDSRKNTFQGPRKPFRVGEDTLDGPTPLGMAVAPQGRDLHNVCFPYRVHNSTKINGTQMSATSSLEQRKPLDVEIYSKKTAEKPCACVQKIIGTSPKLDASLTTKGNESMPAMQLLRLMETGTSSRTPHNAGLQKVTDTHKRPFPVEQGKHHTFGKPMVRIGGTRSQVLEDNVSGNIKSCKKANLKSSLVAHQAKNGRTNGHISGKFSLGRGYESFSFNKGQSSASDNIVLPIEPNTVNGRVKHAKMKKKKKGAVVWAVKGSCRNEICTVNKNPADFSIPGTGNKFMRRGKSENSRKSKAKSTAGSMNGLIPTCVA